MTLFEFIKECLRREAARTEPDCTQLIQKIVKSERERAKQVRPP